MMTYQESFDLAMRLKDFVRLYDDKAWIYLIFTNQTDFYVRIFDQEPADRLRHQIQYDSFYVNNLPTVCVL